MASAALVRKLRQGVFAWNAWRRTHPDVHLDLTGAQLSVVELGTAWRAVGPQTKGRAKHEMQNLDLRGANLSNANLIYADLRGAILSEANLSHAELLNANLAEDILTGAILTDAHFGKTIFAGTWLRRIRT